MEIWVPVLLAVGAGLLGVLVRTVRWRMLLPNRTALREGQERFRRSLALERERQQAVATGVWRDGLAEELEELDRFPGEDEDAREDEREAREGRRPRS